MVKKKIGKVKRKKEHSKLLREEAENFIKVTDEAEKIKAEEEKKGVAKQDKATSMSVGAGELLAQICDNSRQISALEQRIDRIVAAIDKSKSVRGL